MEATIRPIARIAPGPRGHVLLGKLLDIRRDRLEFVTEVTREFGDIVRFRMGGRVLHLVSHPDYIRYVLADNYANYRKGVGLAEARRWLGEGLVTSEGEVWSRQRRLMQPAFHRQRVTRLMSIVPVLTSRMLDDWCEEPHEGNGVNVATEMMQLTLGIITQLMFEMDISKSTEVGQAFTTALRDAMSRMTALVQLPDWLPLRRNREFRRAIVTLNAIVDEIIDAHQSGGQTDLLSMLSGGADERDRFESRELREQVLTILLAGHETTASSLAWTFYLLDAHPWAWERLRAEVDRVAGARPVNAEDLSALKWTRMILEESMRLYPPVWLIPRRAISEDEIGGYQIPADSDVLISTYVMHRHPQYWRRPDEFDPERFAPEMKSERTPYSYLPFGAGPRSCIGSALAAMEAILILATITQRVRLRLVPGFAIQPEPLLTLRFRNGLSMIPIPT